MKKGIKSLGAYLPYHYLTRAALGAAWGGKGGKVPPPGARANAPSGGARLLTLAGPGWSPRPFTRRTISAVSAANECEGITCGSK